MTYSIVASIIFWILLAIDSTELSNVNTTEKDILMCIHTIPVGLMLIEYPLNMIPFDFNMLPFDLLLMLIYLGESLLF